VLAPFAGASDYANHGERVVVGQRMMQAATDVFLGWPRAPTSGISTSGDSRTRGWQLQTALPFCASLRGRTLERAHARAGDPALVSGYASKGTVFEEAISKFAVAYADQTEKDWNAFLAAINSGRIVVAAPETKMS
jgi:hypothetical protein